MVLIAVPGGYVIDWYVVRRGTAAGCVHPMTRHESPARCGVRGGAMDRSSCRKPHGTMPATHNRTHSLPITQGTWETYGIPNRYGTGIDWNEFHTATRYPNETD